MSKLDFPAKMLFGVDGTAQSRAQNGASGQLNGETVSASTGRRTVGVVKGGRFSAHLVIGSGITGSVTVWYSNLPDPDETNDAHWVQDTNAQSQVTLSGAAVNAFLAASGVIAAYWRVKVTVTSGSGTVVCWTRQEGDQSSP